MTIFTGEDDVLPTPSVMDLKSSLGEGLGTTFGEGFMSGARQIAGIGELAGAEHAGERYVPAEGEGTFPSELPLPPMGTFEKLPGTAPDLPIAIAKSKVTEAGLDHILKLPDQPTIKPGVLDIMLDRARHENEVSATMARGPQGVTVTALNAATALAAGAIDPLNIAAALIPGVPEAQVARLMAGAGRNIIARAGARAALGAAQGAEFSAAMVPLDWYAKSQEGQDFTSAMALRQILLGAATFGAIHPVAGAGADIARAWRSRPLYPFAPGDIHGRYATPAAPGEAPGEPLRQAAQAAEPPADDAAARGASASGEARAAVPSDSERYGGAGEPGGPQPAARGGLEGDVEELFHPAEATPFVRAIADLPANVQHDNMRMAIARITSGEPVDVGETLAELAKTDPRIAESLALAHVPPVDTGAQAVHADVAAQLRAAGMSEEEAEHNAAIVAARYTTRAQRLGHADAFTLYQSEGLSIRGPGGDIADEPDLAARIYGQRGGDLFAEREAKGQESLPGTERIGEGELAQRRADQALKPKVAQKPMDEGLFGDSAAQKTLFQSARQAPPFYSALERAVTASKQEKASPDQWLGMLKNTPGVKHEEMDWLGLPDWLKEQKGAVTKQQIADYVRANSVEVREVEHGNKPYDPIVDRKIMRLNDELVRLSQEYHREASAGRDVSDITDEMNSIHDAIGEMENDRNDTTSTKFGQWQLPGGENYRELLLTLPDSGGPSKYGPEETLRLAHDLAHRAGDSWEELGPNGRQQYENEAARMARQQGSQFRGSHWEEPNVLAHVRFNDRMIDGKKTLFIEEIQSDWHQKGKRQGYQQPPKPFEPEKWTAVQTRRGPGQFENSWHVTDPDGNAHIVDGEREADAAIRQAHQREEQRGSNIPDAPFKTSWPELSLKRMIRYAAEHGYDQVAWTPGKVQAERYDLSKQIDQVRVTMGQEDRTETSGPGLGHPVLQEAGIINAYRKPDGIMVISKPFRDRAELSDIIGKEVTDRAYEQLEKNRFTTKHGLANLSGLDLRVGGEGMHGFYDKILPVAANKLVKKFGAKVGDAKMEGVGEEVSRYEGPQPTAMQMAAVGEAANARPSDQRFVSPITNRRRELQINRVANSSALADIRRVMMETGISFQRAMSTYGHDELAEIFGGKMVKDQEKRAETVHTLPLTEALREAAVGEGFPLFQGGEGGPRGRIMLGENKAIIDLFKSADASTFVHEMGHKWLDEMARDAERANVPQALKDDLGTVLRWLGVDKAEDIGTAQHEQWARGFEQYLSEGVAPSARLAAAFEKFKQWLAGIYRAIAGRDVPISDDIRNVMGRMLATDEEIAARAEPAAVHMARRAARGPAARPEATWSLFEFLAARGGLKPDPELAAIFGGRNPFIPGFGPLLRQTGMALDHAREASVEAGYLHDAAQEHGGVTESTVNHLLDALGTQERGTKVYRAGNQPEAKRPGRSDHLDEIEHEMHGALVDAGIDVTSEPDKRMARVLQIMDREGVHDPIAAYERAVMEEDRNAIDHGRAGPHGPIAGWDVPDDRGAAPGAGRGPAGPGAGRPGEGPRQRGAVDRAQAEALWRKLADAGQRDPDAAAALAAQRATEKLPVPESTQAEIPDGAKPGEQSPATKDAVRAAAEADAMWANIEPYMTPEERESFATRIAAAEQDSADRTEVARRGAACLTMAVG